MAPAVAVVNIISYVDVVVTILLEGIADCEVKGAARDCCMGSVMVNTFAINKEVRITNIEEANMILVLQTTVLVSLLL